MPKSFTIFSTTVIQKVFLANCLQILKLTFDNRDWALTC
jgi:hypothetical protein